MNKDPHVRGKYLTPITWKTERRERGRAHTLLSARIRVLC